MTRKEIRSLILSLSIDEEIKLTITDKEYPKFRQEVATARKNGYEIIFWTKASDENRMAILNKKKDGDVEQYKKAIKWE